MMNRNALKSLCILLKAIRVHHWTKNLLLFVPLIMAHRIGERRLLLDALSGFLAFSFCASGAYILNDLLDLESDREHPSKRFRSLPSGEMPVAWAKALIPVLFSIGLGLALLLPWKFAALLLTYSLVTVAYSLYLKKALLVDVFTLAGFHTLRIIAGGLAIGVPVSPWLMAFSMFFFLSLAFAKRYSELFNRRSGNFAYPTGRGYYDTDLEQIGSMGGTSGYISVLVLALYINSREVAVLYSRPYVLWLICPILLYWISRIWLLAHRGVLHEDPIIFSIRDKVSYLTGALVSLVLVVAT